MIFPHFNFELASVIFGLPLVFLCARAFLRALAVARDPAIRVTPADPWDVFRRQLRRSSLPAFAVATVMVAPTAALMWLSPESGSGQGWLSQMIPLLTISLLGGFLFAFPALWFGFVWAPYCSRVWTLTLLMAMSSVAWFAVIKIQPLAIVPGELLIVSLPFVSRLRGPRWFRFEE